MADLRPTQCNMTALDRGWQIGRHEKQTPTFTENRNSQVRGDSDISSGGEFGTLETVSLFLEAKL